MRCPKCRGRGFIRTASWDAKPCTNCSGVGVLDPSTPPPCQEHSETSVAAAIKVSAITTKLQRKVLLQIRSWEKFGCTDEEGGVGSAMKGSTYRPRRIELENMDLVVKTKRTRLTRASNGKSRAAVYVAKEFGGDE